MPRNVISRSYEPNSRVATATPGDQNWHIIASDGTAYTTQALMLAAGKRPYPGLDAGGRIGSCLIHSVTSAGAAGSGVFYALDLPAAPSASDNVLGGSDQQISLSCPFRNIWLKLLASSDSVKLDGRY